MSMISSATSAANSAYNSTGLSGLVSGLDTEQMVEDLMSGTQAKIDAQNATKQQLVWKQEIYRDVINDLNSFQEKFFSYTSETNLLSTSLYHSMSATTSASSVQVTASSSASAGTMTIQSIEQLAASRKERSAVTATDVLIGDLDLASARKEITLTAGANTQTILLVGKTDTELLDHLNTSLATSFGTTLVEGVVVNNVSAVVDDDGKLILSALDADTAMSITGTQMGMTILGLTAGAAGTGLLEGALDASLGTRNLSVNLDGVSKTIELDTDAENETDFTTSLQNAINRAFGNGMIVSNNGSEITFEVTDPSRQITIQGTSDAMDLLGMTSGSSNKINLNLALSDINFAQKIQGSTFEFTINGIEFDVRREDSLASIMAEINTSEANVKISYSSLEDKFLMESTVSGSGTILELTQATGNLLSVLFGCGSSGSVLGLAVADETGSLAAKSDVLSSYGLDVGRITLQVLPAEATILDLANLPGVADPANATIDDLAAALNTALGGDETNQKVLFDETTGKYRILGMTEAVTISGIDNEGANALNTLFGAGSISLNTAEIARDLVTLGQNAILTVNGVQVQRNSNTFSIDGVSIKLLQTTEQSGETNIELNTTQNTNKIVDAVSSFIKEYNSMIEKLNGLIGEDAAYKSYPPLTSAQKAEMSEREIELWEAKAKIGLVRRDDTLTNLLANMRSILYSRVSNSKFALYDLGITTGDWENKGKLVMENPPTALLAALENDPAEIEKLFNNANDGLAVKFNQVISSAAKISSGSPGTLVKLAGAAILSTSNSSMDHQIKDIDDVLDNLANLYEKEKNRYWNQFNTMEALISEMNSMSSWLSSQFE